MKISSKMNSIINKQINEEMNSAYLYLAMATYFEDNNLQGCAGWMKKQANEELSHAMKFYHYVYERNGSVILDAIAKPSAKWKNPLEVFQEAYGHEQKISALVHGIYDSARTEKDFATTSFLKWFLDEQVEEEANVSYIIEKLKMIGNNNVALLMLDKELGERK